jgi:hypothetical protein
LPRSTVPKDDEGILDEFGQFMPGHLHRIIWHPSGTLSLGPPGDARYFGNTARSEYLVHVNNILTSQFRAKLVYLGTTQIQTT